MPFGQRQFYATLGLMTDTRIDGFLGGRLQIAQPVRGYRAGADAVMLAAAVPARRGEAVLELGCGAGVASLCLGARVTGLTQCGLERDPAMADLARDNAVRNDLPLAVTTGDLAEMPGALRALSFDHALMNPPFFRGASPAENTGRQAARHEDTPLHLWLSTGLRRLAPGGTLTVIHLAERLDAVLAALSGPAGAIAVLPIAARQGREAGRVIVQARKGARAPLRLLAPLIMHEKPAHEADEQDLSPQAQHILRDMGSIFMKPSKTR